MVAEKLDAAVEGAFAAQLAWGTFMLKAALGGVRTPRDLAMGLTAVAEAAAQPARREVRADATPDRGQGPVLTLTARGSRIGVSACR